MNPARGALYAACLLLLVLAAHWPLFTLNLGRDELVGGDEGYYANAAENFRYGMRFVANPSLEPQGPPGDKPFLYHTALWAAERVLGPGEASLRLVNVLACFAVVLACAWLTSEWFGRMAGIFAGALGLATPALWAPARTVMAEPLLTALAALGMCLALSRRAGRTRLFLSGALFGLAFLCKLWLVGLIMIPVAAALTGGAIGSSGFSGGAARWALAVLGFAATACLHILLVFLVTPDTLGHWLNIYFAFSLGSRLAGNSYAVYWLQPWWHYVRVLLQVFALGLPFVGFGIARISSVRGGVPRRFFAGAALSLALLSAARVKNFYYLVPLYPAVFVLMGAGADALLSRVEASRPRPGSRLLFLGWLLGAGLVLLSQAGGPGWPRQPQVLGVQICILALCAAPVLFEERRGQSVWLATAAVLLALLAADSRALRDARVVHHAPGYRDLARLLGTSMGPPLPGGGALDRLSGAAAGAPVQYIGPEWPAMAHYLWRSGVYWKSPYGELPRAALAGSLGGDTPVLLLVNRIPAGLYGGDPTAGQLAAVEATAVEGTAWAERRLGRPLGFRVFFNRALARNLDLSPAR